MTDVYSYTKGDGPLLISVPHDGRQLAPGQAETMTPAALRLPDTDWHVGQLYALALKGLNASTLAASFSRYVVDLNRPEDDSTLYEGRHGTGICPTQTFAGDDIYRSGEELSSADIEARIKRYWCPYHAKLRATLERIRDHYGYALLWDAHSIAGRVPLLFDGTLPDLSIGTNNGQSCGTALQDAVMEAAGNDGYSAVLNGRFRGGYITRHYGDPLQHIHAIQLELVQSNYMDEASFRFDPAKASRLARRINAMLKALCLKAVTTFTAS